MQLDEALHDRDLAGRLVRGIENAAASIGREVRIMDMQGDRYFLKEEDSGYDYTTLAFSPAENRRGFLAIGRTDGAIEIWNLDTNDEFYFDFVVWNLNDALTYVAEP